MFCTNCYDCDCDSHPLNRQNIGIAIVYSGKRAFKVPSHNAKAKFSLEVIKALYCSGLILL